MERQREERWEIQPKSGIARAQGIDFSPLFELVAFRADIDCGPQGRRIEVLKQGGEGGGGSPGRIEQGIAGGNELGQPAPILAPELLIALFKRMMRFPYFLGERMIVERHELIEHGLK